MATIETNGQYQLHLVAYELSSGKWDPFVSVHKFDDAAQDFLCVVDKHHASFEAFNTYDEAIEAARRSGNSIIENGKI